MHISIAAEPLFHLWGFPVTNSFLVSIIASMLIIILAFIISKTLKTKPGSSQTVLEALVESGLNLVESVAGPAGRRFFPLFATFFIFILLSNWIGLLPGFGSFGFNKIEEGHKVFVPFFRGATADLNTTLALAIISFAAMEYFGFSTQKLGYLKHYFNLKSPIDFFVGFLELVSDLAKIISFAFRLFGNVFAGEVLLVVISSLIPLIAPLPFFGLEIFVGLIQALVFSMLSLVFFNLASTSGHDKEVITVGH
jgi:F-type H+-transporting ATPase subunit a